MATSEDQNENRPVTTADIDAFRRTYFERADYMYWYDRLMWAWRRHAELKRPENKARQLVDAYSIYMQCVEIMLINMNSLMVPRERFLRSLTIDNFKIREFGQKVLDDRDLLRKFTKNGIYQLRNEQPTEAELNFDVSTLRECIQDYLKNYNFLNSYKHGFRVNSASGPNFMAFGKGGGPTFKLFEGDSQLTYYDFRKDDGVQSMYETTIYFKHSRVFGKSLFTIIYLMNMRLFTLRGLGDTRRYKRPFFIIYDKEDWDNAFGDGRWSKGLFSFVKRSQE